MLFRPPRNAHTFTHANAGAAIGPRRRVRVTHGGVFQVRLSVHDLDARTTAILATLSRAEGLAALQRISATRPP